MSIPNISVVIPAYNVAAFIVETLDSLFAQAFEPVEILIVNDGSTDGTVDVIREHYGDKPCIKILDQPNQGVGKARSNGLAMAKGDYIFFVDPDDVVANGLFEAFAKQVQASPALELYYFSKRSFVDNPGNRDFLRRDTATRRGGLFETGADVLEDLILSGKYNAATWQYIFSQKVCRRFEARFSRRSHEDHVFSMNIYLHAGQTYADQADRYFQRVRPGSLTRKPRDADYVDGAYQAYRETLSAFKAHSSRFAAGSRVAQTFMARNVNATIAKCIKENVPLPRHFFQLTRQDTRAFGITSPELLLRAPELRYFKKKSRAVLKKLMRTAPEPKA
jgi:glycosyltransferase involved in cell wall biosynthesis